MKIRVDPASLAERGNEILLLRDVLEETMDKIEVLVLSLDASWQGDAEKAFAARILYLKKELSGLTDFFGDCSALLLSAAEQYRIRDDTLATKINLI